MYLAFIYNYTLTKLRTRLMECLVSPCRHSQATDSRANTERPNMMDLQRSSGVLVQYLQNIDCMRSHRAFADSGTLTVSTFRRSVQYFCACSSSIELAAVERHFAGNVSKKGLIGDAIKCSSVHCKHLHAHSRKGRPAFSIEKIDMIVFGF